MVELIKSQPANPAIGDTVLWEALVTNQGLGNAHAFRVSIDSDPNDACGGWFIKFSSLGGGQDETEWITTTILPGRDYRLVVDSCGTVTETDEGNNTYALGQFR